MDRTHMSVISSDGRHCGAVVVFYDVIIFVRVRCRTTAEPETSVVFFTNALHLLARIFDTAIVARLEWELR